MEHVLSKNDIFYKKQKSIIQVPCKQCVFVMTEHIIIDWTKQVYVRKEL